MLMKKQLTSVQSIFQEIQKVMLSNSGLETTFKPLQVPEHFTYNVWVDDLWLPCEFRSLSETLTVPIQGLSPGLHSLVIEVRDAYGNLSLGNQISQK